VRNLGGDKMPGKTLRCRLHFHHWETLRGPDGDSYDVCARCKVDRAYYNNGDPEGTYVAMDYSAWRDLGKSFSRKQRRSGGTPPSPGE
jgi:hypothetical protein